LKIVTRRFYPKQIFSHYFKAIFFYLLLCSNTLLVCVKYIKFIGNNEFFFFIEPYFYLTKESFTHMLYNCLLIVFCETTKIVCSYFFISEKKDIKIWYPFRLFAINFCFVYRWNNNLSCFFFHSRLCVFLLLYKFTMIYKIHSWFSWYLIVSFYSFLYVGGKKWKSRGKWKWSESWSRRYLARECTFILLIMVENLLFSQSQSCSLLGGNATTIREMHPLEISYVHRKSCAFARSFAFSKILTYC